MHVVPHLLGLWLRLTGVAVGLATALSAQTAPPPPAQTSPATQAVPAEAILPGPLEELRRTGDRPLGVSRPATNSGNALGEDLQRRLGAGQRLDFPQLTEAVQGGPLGGNQSAAPTAEEAEEGRRRANWLLDAVGKVSGETDLGDGERDRARDLRHRVDLADRIALQREEEQGGRSEDETGDRQSPQAERDAVERADTLRAEDPTVLHQQLGEQAVATMGITDSALSAALSEASSGPPVDDLTRMQATLLFGRSQLEASTPAPSATAATNPFLGQSGNEVGGGMFGAANLQNLTNILNGGGANTSSNPFLQSLPISEGSLGGAFGAPTSNSLSGQGGLLPGLANPLGTSDWLGSGNATPLLVPTVVPDNELPRAARTPSALDPRYIPQLGDGP